MAAASWTPRWLLIPFATFLPSSKMDPNKDLARQIARAEQAERRCTLPVANEASIMRIMQVRMQKLQQLDELVLKLDDCQEYKARLQCQAEHLQQWLRGSRVGRGSQVGALSYLSMHPALCLPCLMGPGHSSCC